MSKSSKKNVPKKNSSVRPYTVMCTDLYLLWILLVYPLYYADGYFHLPERKATFWCTSTLVYIGVTLLGVIITYVSTRDEWSLERIKKNISMTDIFMFGFLISNLIAFALSEDKTNAWTGATGRYYGAKVLILVCISYFLISRYAWVNKVFIWAFLIGGNGVCLLATFDYFGMDVLGINQQMQASDWLVFISTMGNANTCASYVTMAVAGAICYFCVAEDMKSKIFAGISVVSCSMALITARSDSAFVGIGAILIVLGIMVIIRVVKIKDCICGAIFVDLGLIVLLEIRDLFEGHLLDAGADDGVANLCISNKTILFIGLTILVFIYFLTRYVEGREVCMNKINKKIMMGIIASSVLVIGIGIIWKLQIIQLFKESIGAIDGFNVGSRIYIYKITIESFIQSPFQQKILGWGQASIGGVLGRYFGEELYRWGMSINSAHNGILDYLISVGVLGVICYLGIICSIIKKGFRVIKNNFHGIVFFGIIISYFVQSCFNIEQTNTTPVFWLMIAMLETMHRNSDKENSK